MQLTPGGKSLDAALDLGEHQLGGVERVGAGLLDDGEGDAALAARSVPRMP